MNFQTRSSRAVRIAAVAALVGLAPVAGFAEPTPTIDNGLSSYPTARDLQGLSPAGSYLAARHASADRDAGVAASFYRAALRLNPKNNDLLDRAFISSVADGEMEEAVKLAGKILAIDKTNRVARLVEGVHALKQKKYTAAQQHINQSVRGPITDLVATLLSSYAMQGAGNTSTALANIDKLTGPEWYPIFKNLHAGLIDELANRQKDAGVRFEAAYKLDDTALRIVDAYGRWLSRNKGPTEATALFETFSTKVPRHPMVLDALKDLKAGKKLPAQIDTPQAGAAEALYGIGSSLTRRGGEDLALIYLQLALYLQPTHPLALLSLADLYESVKKPQFAIKVYERMPANSPLKRNAQIQLATDLDSVERTDEAVKILEDVVASDAKDTEALTALGNIQRARKKFDDCSETYTKAIDSSDASKPSWVLFYFRGICEERSKRWPKAEADLKKALELQPEQAHVLNYLGYSWVDKGMNLPEGMAMIRRAVEQRPDDGYIVDSLGWAYYRIGDYDNAVKTLERAIDLKPEDPTINDHLGDAYWRVGRTLEAKYQWTHARDLKPEAEELPKIEEKIANGLPDLPPGEAAASVDKKKDDKGG
ncbi:tetratricopeptide TPR_2 [Afipia carboxidovorans OM5]|uniref:TPR repeat protein n=1 Tax=Afipia carboxidovorans (strain ATCC 49405 / DSM 1227 / KCTC 32145 / OM5) TaxID=504832 RepID=B6JEZ7_AFIC5|nr:tetratricopeptide repeat protein [Afipia carboxidovorans]ACI94068.1 tetratricopeptide TPR_2 [Afipia carboxidovorans OM5]AEI02270.1 TPR repeat protein [Afipia carboxidovorans OM4]AEI05846.1 TPR repeat protein [Afipia carboxidovorans OM5]